MDSIAFLVSRDSVLKSILEIYGEPYIPVRSEGFETLCKLILEQQVSLASAKAAYLKLNEFVLGIEPNKLVSMTDEVFRFCSISRQKASYLRDLSNKILNKELEWERFSEMEESSVRENLLKVKGIGNWTVDIYLMFSLRKENVFPVGDIAVKNVMKELYQIESVDKMEEYSQNWHPFRSMATYILWHYYLSKRNRQPLVY